MGLILSDKNKALIIDETKTLSIPNSIDFEILSVFDDIDVSFEYYSVNDSDDFEQLLMIFDAFNVDLNQFEHHHINDRYLKLNRLIIIHFNFASSDGNPSISKIDNYGSYLNIVTTSDNQKDGFESFDFHQKIIIIRVNQDDVRNVSICKHGIEYLKK
ncbi:MAG: hypothetical protein WCR19_00025 [Acholeplasmataceae bacterium]